MKFENWALLVQGQEVVWEFGSLEKEQKERTVLFLNGLHNIGKEIFDKGIATIKLKRSKNFLKGDELFIVNLEGSFFLIIFDPLVTIKKMSMVEIPEDMDLIIRSVLIGQASITYANLMSTATKEAGTHIDMLFQQALDEVVLPEKQQELNVFVNGGTCSFAGLTTIECLIFHLLIRRFFEVDYKSLVSNAWAIIQHESSIPIFLDHNAPKHPHLLGGYLTVIQEYILDIFNSHLESMVFGGGDLSSIESVHGKEHFMSICNPVGLFRDPVFLSKFQDIDTNVRSDIGPSLVEYLAKNLSDLQYQQYRQYSLKKLIWEFGNPDY